MSSFAGDVFHKFFYDDVILSACSGHPAGRESTWDLALQAVVYPARDTGAVQFGAQAHPIVDNDDKVRGLVTEEVRRKE
jgi:hypothetical protein